VSAVEAPDTNCRALLQVLNSGGESKKCIAEFLAIPALRRVISTFANDPCGQFADWSTNPQVRGINRNVRDSFYWVEFLVPYVP